MVVGVRDGIRGRFLVAWLALPLVILARHSLDVLFHYLYLDLPAVALTVGMLGAWVGRRGRLERGALVVALATYAAVSLWMLTVVLQFVESFDPAATACAALQPGGGPSRAPRCRRGLGRRRRSAVRNRRCVSLGYDVPSRDPGSDHFRGV